MNKRKLGVILATIGGVGLFVCFILFTLGGFMSVRYMKTSPLTIIGFIGFGCSIAILIAGSAVRGSGDIKELISSNTMNKMLDTANKKISSINKTTCDYCGTVYDSKETKCPNCGSSTKK